MTPDQTPTNAMLPALLPKHTEIVPAKAGRHAVELADYHHWLPSEPAPEGAASAAPPPAGRDPGRRT